MLPLFLSLTGLYSYQKKQVIDFKELTDAGLFGIFGAVGSGKSSILEAIGFVLYADTERLNKNEKRSYNMLNLKSDLANIEFEFLNFEDRKFKFTANWKRKKRFEETTTIERFAYEWKDNIWVPLDSNDATPIIGLTYKNFKRTIIIPQGKFKEFLDLTGMYRSDMMKEIFHLGEFDLSDKVKTLQSSTKSKLDELKGALSRYEETTQENIVVLEEELAVAEKELLQNKTESAIIDAEFTRLMTLKNNFEGLEKKKSELTLLTERKPLIDKLASEIASFEKTEKVFKELLNRFNSKKIALENLKKQYVSFVEQKNNAVKIIEENKVKINILQPLFDTLETTKSKVSDLESIEKIIVFKTDLIVVDEKIKNADTLFNQAEKKEQELKSELVEIQKQLIAIKTKRMDANLLVEIGNWYNLQENHSVKLAEIIQKSAQVQNEIVKQKEMFTTSNLPFENWKQIVVSKKEVLLQQKKGLQAVQTKLMVSKELAHFADNLHEGENCPLCGALEHPNVMQAEDVSVQLQTNKSALSRLELQEAQLAKTTLMAEKFELSFSLLKSQLDTFKLEKLTTETAIETHMSKFVWIGFDATDNTIFDSKNKEQIEVEKGIKEIEDKEKAVRLLKEAQETALKIQLANRSILIAEQASKSGTITNELTQLKKLLFSDYDAIPLASIQAERVQLNQENNRIATDYDIVSKEKIKQEQELAGINGSLVSIKVQLELNETEVEKNQDEITEQLKEHQFNSIDEVQIILSKSWDITTEKAKTTQFVIDLKISENTVAEAEKLMVNQIFDIDIFKEKQLLLASAKEKTDAQFGKVTFLQTNLNRILEEFKQKVDLQKEFDVVQTRYVNLNTLSNMFNGRGFVNYVSSIYLQNLADSANVRFHRMTKSQLSLTIDTSNEFEVIDYLNNGARRSVKTLSGGQGFQASLCLALALAESVQSLNKNDKNFFFIDEGFGTQDAESIAIVFETLQTLYKENRIVGIISHVAELQERIPRSINVVKDEEKGSFVSESWN